MDLLQADQKTPFSTGLAPTTPFLEEIESTDFLADISASCSSPKSFLLDPCEGLPTHAKRALPDDTDPPAEEKRKKKSPSKPSSTEVKIVRENEIDTLAAAAPSGLILMHAKMAKAKLSEPPTAKNPPCRPRVIDIPPRRDLRHSIGSVHARARNDAHHQETSDAHKACIPVLDSGWLEDTTAKAHAVIADKEGSVAFARRLRLSPDVDNAFDSYGSASDDNDHGVRRGAGGDRAGVTEAAPCECSSSSSSWHALRRKSGEADLRSFYFGARPRERCQTTSTFGGGVADGVEN